MTAVGVCTKSKGWVLETLNRRQKIQRLRERKESEDSETISLTD